VQIEENIRELRRLGFFVSIDDFGVEYTSLPISGNTKWTIRH
jgi:EAL domain-containing protein (putative c-di-GMP-specific phosphodiesterase class I)